MTRKKGRPTVEAERNASGRIKYPQPLRVMMSKDAGEAAQLATAFEQRLGREGLLKLLNMPRDKFDELINGVEK